MNFEESLSTSSAGYKIKVQIINNVSFDNYLLFYAKRLIKDLEDRMRAKIQIMEKSVIKGEMQSCGKTNLGQ